MKVVSGRTGPAEARATLTTAEDQKENT